MNCDSAASTSSVIGTSCDGSDPRLDQHTMPDSDYHNQVINHPSIERPNKPIGITLFCSCFRFNNASSKRTFYKAFVLCITFIAYTCFHMGRRPLSIVKNVLNRNCSKIHHVTRFDELQETTYVEWESLTDMDEDPNWCDWPPFNNDATANQLLALLDSAFLFSYAFFMFFSGFFADRCNLRYFLSSGMILSGLLLYAFGLSFYLNIHSMTYFVIVQILSGAIQTTGWPSVVSCLGNWFEPSSRGAIFGVWNANTNLGNILGATIAGFFVERAWGLSFIVLGFIMLGAGVLVFLFLVPKPEDVGLLPIKSLSDPKSHSNSITHNQRDLEGASETVIDQTTRGNTSRRKPTRYTDIDSAVSESDDSHISIHSSENSPLIATPQPDEVEETELGEHPVSFWVCLRIPGVIEYSLCLGFAKLVSYTFLYWLPRYITQSTQNNSEESAYLSVPFDLGGIIGAILAGYVSDKSKKSAVTCTVMLIFAIPAMFVYEKFASISNLYNVCLQLLAGAMVNGPYALITTTVSTDLGTRVKNGKAMASVAAIIDGTGSIGAAIGPLFAGYVSDSGWQSVFMMLMVSDLLALVCLTRVTLKELGFR